MKKKTNGEVYKMGLGEYFRINTTGSDVFLDIYRGHYATSHSHTNYYIDISKTTASITEARAVANALAAQYQMTTVVDTILCMDGTEVIGAFLARELTKEGYGIVNGGNDICVLRPEYTQGSQIFFRDNTKPMIEGKKVLILAASVVTGFTAKSAIEAIHYYGGRPVGIASIYANITSSYGVPVESIFNTNDLPGYVSSMNAECPMCKRGEKINGLVNMFGISAL